MQPRQRGAGTIPNLRAHRHASAPDGPRSGLDSRERSRTAAPEKAPVHGRQDVWPHPGVCLVHHGAVIRDGVWARRVELATKCDSPVVTSRRERDGHSTRGAGELPRGGVSRRSTRAARSVRSRGSMFDSSQRPRARRLASTRPTSSDRLSIRPPMREGLVCSRSETPPRFRRDDVAVRTSSFARLRSTRTPSSTSPYGALSTTFGGRRLASRRRGPSRRFRTISAVGCRVILFLESQSGHDVRRVSISSSLSNGEERCFLPRTSRP